jgi:hypothetical protein
MNIEEEQWAAIEGFPNYAVSNIGNVKSLRFDRLLNPRSNSYGLLRVTLYHERQAKEFYVHHLVAAAFIDGYIPGKQVRHRQDNEDNNVYNLKFPKGIRLGRLVKEPPAPVYRRIFVPELSKVFNTIQECADELEAQTASIYRVLRGERPHHLGYTFQYIEGT